MSWIKLETHTFDKVEIYAIAQELGIDPDAVVGKCCRVWAWFDANTVDGVTKSVTSALLDRQTGVTGFCNAMISVGWMIKDGQNIYLPNYERHNSKTAKSRALGAIRQSKFRSNANSNDTRNDDSNAHSNDTCVTETLPKSSYREEKRREEKNIKTNADKPAYSEIFLQAWQAYPTKPGANKSLAYKQWLARVKAGFSEEQLFSGAKNYADHIRSTGTQIQYVKNAETFFGKGEHFLSNWSGSSKSDQIDSIFAELTNGN